MNWGRSGIRRMLADVLSRLSGSASARDEAVMTAEEFTRAYAAKVEELFPDLRATIKESLEIVIETGTATDSLRYNNYLDNAFAEYVEDPTRAGEIMHQYITGVASAFGEGSDVKREQLVLVIRHRESLNASIDSDRGFFTGRSLAGDLQVFYAFDRPHTIAYATRETIDALGLQEQELEAVALENLRRIRMELEIEIYPTLSVVRGTDAYMQSIILEADFWTVERFPFRGDIVAIVVARDLMLVTGSGENDGLEAAMKLAHEVLGEAPYAISSTPIVRRNGEWQPFLQ